MCRHSSPKTIRRGQRPRCCTTITSLCLVFPNVSCRIKERNSVGRSLWLCAACSAWKRSVTPYHPQTNGSAERVHQTLQRMIGKLDPEKRKKVAGPHWINYHCLQLYKVVGDRILPVLPYVQVQTPVTHPPTFPDVSDANVDPYY